jgi:hypothetical protein
MFDEAADTGWRDGGSAAGDSDELDSVFNMESVSRAASRAGDHTPRGHRARPYGVGGRGNKDDDDTDLRAGDKLQTLLRPKGKRKSLGHEEEKDVPVVDSRAVAEILLSGMVETMGAVNGFFKGASGVETQAVWDKVAIRGKRFDEIRRKHGEDADDELNYDLGEHAKILHHKNKVLEAVSIFRVFIEDVNECCKQGEVARKRVLELGGGDMVVAATKFVKEEALLETCVDSIRFLNREEASRRYLLKGRIDCTDALSYVLSKPHKALVVEHSMEGLSWLCKEEGVTSRLIHLGVLNAVIKLSMSVRPTNVNVLSSCAHMAHRMAGDHVCSQVMAGRAHDVAGAMLRIIKVCDDNEAVANASMALGTLCLASNRVTFGRHPELTGLAIALER